MVAHPDDERMKFVIVLRQSTASGAAHARNRMTRIRGGIFYDERLRCRVADGLFNHDANFFVRGFPADDAVAQQHAARVGVHDEDGMIAGIEQDGIGSFGADAVEFQQLCSKLSGRLGEHARERAGILAVEESDEGLEIARFLAEVAGGTHQRFEFIERNLAHGADAEAAGASQICHGFFHVAPVGVLRKVGADDDFKARAGRPPVLRAIAGEESGVILRNFTAETRRRGGKRSGDRVIW